jgi:DNA-binding CsgD family transcriptional regulator
MQEREALQLSVSGARGDEVKQIEAATRLAQVELRILETKKKITTEIASDLKKQAEAAEDAFNTEERLQSIARARNADQSKSSSVSRADADKELQILRLRADGQTKAADEAARELSIRQSARQIADQQNISYKSALEQAREIAKLEDEVNKSAEKGRRIQGYSFERQGGTDAARSRAGMMAAQSEQRRSDAYSRSFGGLKEFSANQTNPNFARPQTPMLDAAFGPVVNAVQQQTEVIRSLLTVD